MNIKNNILLFAVAGAITTLSGCSQWTITGQNSLLKVNDTSGTQSGGSEGSSEPKVKDTSKAQETGDAGFSEKAPSDKLYGLVGIYTRLDNNKDRSIKLPSDVVAISLKTLYLKYIQSIWDFDVIVYAEVYDVVDETKVLKRVAFHRLNQPSSSYLNMAGNMLYGPIHFEGHPITIKFYVFELDKKNNEVLSEVLKTVSSFASAAQPQYGTAIETVSSIMQYIINTNQDDLELSQEITLYPLSDIEKNYYVGTASLVAPLEASDLVIVKREDKDRVILNRWWWFDKRSEVDAKKEFESPQVLFDATTGRLTVGGKDFEDKTYAVLTISKPAKAVDRAILDQISTNVQGSLGDILIQSRQSDADKIEALRKMGAAAEATVRTFKIKNSISGKAPAEKEKVLLKQYKSCGDSEADKRVKREIEILWEEETGKTADELTTAAKESTKEG